MNYTIPQIPDYERLCEVAKRHPQMDPEAVMATATVHAVGVELAAAMHQSLAGWGISESRLRMLAILMCRGAAMTSSELAEESGVTKGTITGLIDGLERDGFVRRQPCEADRRSTLIRLTPAGQASLDRILPEHLSRVSRLMAGLTQVEQRTLVRLLMKVQSGLPALRGEEPAASQAPTAGKVGAP